MRENCLTIWRASGAGDELPDHKQLLRLPDNRDVTLSVAFKRELYLSGHAIQGGRLSALDVDNSFQCCFEALTINPDGARHGVRIADHSDAIWLDNVTFKSHARQSDILIGWRPGIVPSSRWHKAGIVVLRDVRAEDGRPVTVTVWDGPLPHVINSNVDVRLVGLRMVRAAQWLHAKGLLP